MTSVSIIKCEGYFSAKEKIVNAFEDFGKIGSFFTKGDNILIKPNLLGPQRTDTDPVITNPTLILALCELLLDFGLRVSIGDSPAWSNPKHILTKAGIYESLQKMNIDVINLNKAEDRLKIYTKSDVIKDYKIINLPKLKVHSQLGFSLSVKNLFGCISGKRKAILHMIHGDKQNLFGEMLVRNYKEISPVFTLVDAIVSMNKNGPIWGEPKDTNLLFAGVDCVAIDRAALLSLGYNKSYRIIEAAKKLGIGEWNKDNIKIQGSGKEASISLSHPHPMPISFSPFKVAKSLIKNIIINKTNKEVNCP